MLQSSVYDEGLTPDSALFRHLHAIASHMSAWLKLLGFLSMVCGALAVLTLVGILLAWVPFWLGILLYQAGSRASRAQDPREMAAMLEKLRSYFAMLGTVVILTLAFVIMFLVYFSDLVAHYGAEIGAVLNLYM